MKCANEDFGVSGGGGGGREWEWECGRAGGPAEKDEAAARVRLERGMRIGAKCTVVVVVVVTTDVRVAGAR